MNRILTTLAITFATLSLVSCSDDNSSGGENAQTPHIARADLTGEWKLQEWAPDTNMKKNVYLQLNEDNTFTLYGENFNELGNKKETGKFEYQEADKLIKGTYSDNKPWGDQYTITYMSKDKSIMKWQAQKDKEDISVYVRTEIPDEVKNAPTRAAVDDEDMRIL